MSVRPTGKSAVDRPTARLRSTARTEDARDLAATTYAAASTYSVKLSITNADVRSKSASFTYSCH